MIHPHNLLHPYYEPLLWFMMLLYSQESFGGVQFIHSDQGELDRYTFDPTFLRSPEGLETYVCVFHLCSPNYVISMPTGFQSTWILYPLTT